MTTTNTNALRAAIEAAMRRRYTNARGVSVVDGATSISTQRAGAVIDEPGIIREVCVLTHISADALGALAVLVGLRVETCGACNGRGRHAYGREVEDGCDACECAGIVVVDPAEEVASLDDVARGAFDDIAGVRAELDAARAALRQYAPRCECGALATRTVGYDDCEPSTLRRVCDREACGRGLPVSGESAHAAAVRAAVLR